jgi:hypothetical protein
MRQSGFIERQGEENIAENICQVVDPARVLLEILPNDLSLTRTQSG